MVASWRFGWSEEDMKSAYFSSEESAKTAQRKKNLENNFCFLDKHSKCRQSIILGKDSIKQKVTLPIFFS